MTRRTTVLIFALAFALLIVGASGGRAGIQPAAVDNISVADHGSAAPASPVSVELSVSDVSGAEATLTVTLSSADHYDADGLSASISLPAGVSPLGGDLSWSGDLAAGQSASFSSRVRVDGGGEHEILASARVDAPEVGGYYGGTDVLYLTAEGASPSISGVADLPYDDGLAGIGVRLDDEQAAAAGAIVAATAADGSPAEAPTLWDNGAPSQPMPEDLPQTGESDTVLDPEGGGEVAAASGGPIVQSHTGTIRITGRAFYRDIDLNGTLRSFTFGAGFAEICVFDRDTFGGDDLLGCQIAAANGTFDLTVSNCDGLFLGICIAGGQEPYVRVRASNTAGQVTTGGGSIYTWFTTVFGTQSDGATLNVGNWTNPNSNAQNGAWMIFSIQDGLMRGWNYLANIATPSRITPFTRTRYPFESGAHYHTGNDEIHIPNILTARSPSVILHEYGHHIMESYYAAFPPNLCPSPHFINGSHNVQCAWTEGVPSWFGQQMLGTSVYTDLNGGFAVNYETNNPGNTGDTVESRVTAAMWDIADGPNDGVDTYAEGFNPQWKTFELQDDTTYFQFYTAHRSGKTNFRKYNIKKSTFQNTIDYNSRPFVVMTNLSGWQSGNILAQATIFDADPEDKTFLSTQFFNCATGPVSVCSSIGTDTTESGICTTGCGFSRTWNSAGVNDPTRWFRGIVSDGMESRSDSTNSFFGVDNTDPTTVINSPAGGALLSSSPVSVNFQGADTLSGVVTTQIRMDFGPWFTNLGTGPHIRSFALADGVHTACARATDFAGNTSTPLCNRAFTLDTTSPVLTLPADITVDATGPSGAAVSYAATAIDAIDPTVVPVCLPASASTFPIGSTTVNCTATDDAGNSSSGSFNVTVVVNDSEINASLGSPTVTTSLDAADPRAPAGVFTITATWTNGSTDSYFGMFAEVATLSGSATGVLNCDRNGPGVGCEIDANLGADSVLSPGESFTMTFEIGLNTVAPFNFFVDMRGGTVVP